MALSAGELASMQATQRQLLPDVATISDFAVVADDYGGVTEGWTARAGTFPARLGSVDDRAMTVFAGRLQGKAAHTVTLEALTPIDERDRITLAGATYAVVAVLAPASWESARRVLVTQEG